MMNGKGRYRPCDFVLEIIMLAASLVVVVPLLLALFGSFKSPAEALHYNILPPSRWHPENYYEVVRKSNILAAFKNSVIITAAVASVTIIICSLASFIIARRGDRICRFLASYFNLALIVPMAIVPTILLLQRMHLMNTKTGMIFVMIASNISWGMFIMTSFMHTIPREMDEAAIIDGCGPVRLFYLVIFPLLKPVIMTNIVIIGMGTWNDLQTPLYMLNSSRNLTMPLTVYNFMGRYFSQWNLIFADLVLVGLPMVLMYAFLQKYIVSGITAGAVKG
ncbi:MAG: carbohydrate ABC transporter permease [Treponema sp.]|jgi:raffinose/stachyose/melibiose transport system permease protein|nr:carbohydrate ABC transporter permease [Treponema sp.]